MQRPDSVSYHLVRVPPATLGGPTSDTLRTGDNGVPAIFSTWFYRWATLPNCSCNRVLGGASRLVAFRRNEVCLHRSSVYASGVHAAGHYRTGRRQAPEHPAAYSTCGPDLAHCPGRGKWSGPCYRCWNISALGGGNRLNRCSRWGVCRISHTSCGSVQGTPAGPRCGDCRRRDHNCRWIAHRLARLSS